MFQEKLAKIAKVLKNHHIPYMVIGGQAVLIYGEPRLTRDIDITLGISSSQLDQLLLVVKELSLRPLPKNIHSFVQTTMVLPTEDMNSGIRVDFIFSFTPYEEQAIKKAKSIEILREKVSFASPEDLIIHKIFAGRPQDITDTQSTIARNPKIDFQYIRAWLALFDRSDNMKKGLLKRFNSCLKQRRKS